MPLKDKKGIKITYAFQNFLDESNCKPNKIQVDKGSEFYNRFMKSWQAKKTFQRRTFQMKPLDLTSSIYIDFNKENNKVLNLKLVIM